MLMKLTPGTIVFNFPYSRLNEHLRCFLFEPSASFTSSAETTKNQKISEHYEKMTLKLNFENCEKLVPTRILTQTFEFKFRMQGLTKIADSLLTHSNNMFWKPV